MLALVEDGRIERPERLGESTAALVEGLVREARSAGIPFSVASLGGMFGIFFRATPPASLPAINCSMRYGQRVRLSLHARWMSTCVACARK